MCITLIVGKIETGERRLDVLEFIDYCETLNADPHAVIELVKTKQHG